ncbi:MAG TPA: pitrilysin family protein [Ignavibacteriaceae bacterium]|nr:pitrilysin family protein [Ignavibacteriaceae bacterium]
MNHLDLNYEKYKLPNGLQVILHKADKPHLVAVNLWYKVGSAYEVKGKTGLAHLFEHMMFQGSENVPKEMHFKHIQEAGGSLNASTAFDRTNYYEKLPSNYLELALWLESDRMGFFLPALTQEKLDNQKDVVKNERLERYDNQPYGLAWELMLSNIYPLDHPYNNSTIGSLNDISSFTLDDVTSFFKKYYSPANASLVIAGNFEFKKAKCLVEKYFSEIPDFSALKSPSTQKNHLNENKFLTHYDKVQLERIYFTWPSVNFFHEDEAALIMLASILTDSKKSRLYNSIVYENEIAQDVSAYNFSGKFGGHFMIAATVKPGKSIEQVKDEIFKEIKFIAEDSITENELLKTKNILKSHFVYSLQRLDLLADMINSYDYYLDEPNSLAGDLSRFTKLKTSDIKDVVNKYLFKPFFELRILPEKNR